MVKSPVQNVVEAALRRRLLVISVEHSAIALGAVCSGIVLLLLVGTEILQWPWLLLLGAVGIAFAGLRTRRRLSSRYRVAQTIDRKLALEDTISTAWFLIDKNRQNANPFAAAQIENAERAAAQVRPAEVFPFTWKREWTAVCALTAIAFGLFALRYLVTNSFSFKPALLPMPTFSASAAVERIEKLFAKKQEPNPGGNDFLRQGKAPLEGPLANDRGTSNNNKTPGSGASNAAASAAKPEAGQGSNPNARDGSGGTTSNGGRPRPDEANSPHANDGKGDFANRKPAPASLSEKMRDALSGLMEKMRPQEASSGKQESSGQSANRERGAEEADGQQQNGKQRESQPGEGESREQSAQAASQARAAETAASRAQAASAGADNKSANAQSGIGRQDGEKRLQEAEQLRAMGRLDEIIGKRSASLTGEMRLEVRGGGESLETQYSGRVGHHEDLGGAIQRDAVPPELQNYVRQYMEEVHNRANGNR